MVLVSEFNKICKSCHTDHMCSLRMQRLFYNSSHIVKNKTMSLTLLSNSTLSNNFNLHCFDFFDIFDLSTNVLKQLELCKKVFFICLTKTLKPVKLTLFLTYTYNYSDKNYKL